MSRSFTPKGRKIIVGLVVTVVFLTLLGLIESNTRYGMWGG